MSSGLDSPLIVFIVSLVAQWLAALIGDFLGKMRQPLGKDQQDDFETVQNASLTLLALIIAFSFAMAVTRYDQRKKYEEAEANSIGTEYTRADLLPAEDTAKVRELLRQYLDQRVAFYSTRNQAEIRKINADTAKLQAELWSAVFPAANAKPTEVVALAVSGMNDVLNSQGYTQAAWWDRIPNAAWWMMGLIAISCNLLVGYGERRRSVLLLLVLPAIISISLSLIADIDSPRGGIIRVLPENLISLSQSLRAQ
jgi:hypothetical protein